jgi:hydroxyacylglutathione hydrolase
MLLRQILNEDLGCASYLVACGGEAAIIDPQYDIAPYLQLAELHGLRITRVLETHDHADHVSGHGRLVAATGATVHAPQGTGAAYPHEVVRDGDVVAVGNVRIHVIGAPGHRPEHVAYGIEDLARGEGIAAIATGDSLLVGDVARPDLAVDPSEGGPALHSTIARLVAMGDEIEVLPGHVGGSLCGSDRLSGRPTSTIGYEKAHDPLVCEPDPQAFTEQLLEGLKPRPPHVDHVVSRNRAAFSATWVDPAPLQPADVAAAIEQGAAVIDVRSVDAFHAGHVPGSAMVPAGEPGVGTRAAMQVEPDRRIVLVAGGQGQARAVTGLLHAVGLDDTIGFLDGGIDAWRADGREVAGMAAMPIEQLAELLDQDAARDLVVLDVRERDEWEHGIVEGAQLRSLSSLAAEPIHADSWQGRRVAVVCRSGTRAGQAAAMLQRAGVVDVVHVTGGGVPDLPRHGVELHAWDAIESTTTTA